MNEADPIAAVREEDATGEVAAIYADLRATLDLPFVNLIWRHLATIPGGLPWTWGLLKPIYLSPQLEQRAVELRAGLRLPDVPVPEYVWESVGVGVDDRVAISALIADYNRANSVNILALLAALAVLGDRDDAAPRQRTGPVRAEPRAGPLRNVPRLLSLAELPTSLLSLVRELDGLGRLGPSVAIASLYRHLGHWPAFLALCHTALTPHHRSGALQAEQARLITDARRIASAELLSLRSAHAPDLAPEPRRMVLAALDDFTGLMIGRMVVMGEAMLGLLPPPSD